jgi:hypothetical protein
VGQVSGGIKGEIVDVYLSNGLIYTLSTDQVSSFANPIASNHEENHEKKR